MTTKQDEKKFKIGLQLFGVRESMAIDVEKTLKAVKEMGYDYVELAGYYGKTAQELKSILDKYELKTRSCHQGYDVFLGDKAKSEAEFLKTLGIKYCIIPYMGKEFHKGGALNCYEKTVADITRVGEFLKSEGITLGYHNHNFEFDLCQNTPLLDWLYSSIDAKTLEAELDTCWVTIAKFNASEYIKKYSNRAHVLHLKDFFGEYGKENFAFCPLGSGEMKFKPIIETAKKTDIEYLIVEQDTHATDVLDLDCAKKSIEYLKTIL